MLFNNEKGQFRIAFQKNTIEKSMVALVIPFIFHRNCISCAPLKNSRQDKKVRNTPLQEFKVTDTVFAHLGPAANALDSTQKKNYLD